MFTTPLRLLYIFFMVKVNVATWNVCGISSEDRKLLVAKDIDRYNLDIIALQETKTREFAQITLPGHHHLYLFDQKQDWHGGLGFVINKRFTDCIMSYHQISDRVAYIDTKLKPTDNSSAPCYIRFINCYSPTNPKSVQNPQVADKFYDQLEKASDVPARYEVWFLGDFNAKLGKRSWNDEENGLSSHIGKYGVGRRNENGDRLLQFLVSHTLFAANTAFQHASRHITTRTGWIKDQSTRKSRPYYSQIDYILCKSRSRVLLTNARSYAGTTHRSDHKLVIASIDFSRRYKLYKSSTKKQKHFNTNSLVCSSDTQGSYQNCLDAAIHSSKSSDTYSDAKNAAVSTVGYESVKSAAVSTVGYSDPVRKRHHSSDSAIVNMSTERKDLLNQLNTNKSTDRTSLRAKINRLSNDIQKRLKLLKTQLADSVADTINNTDDSRRMFEAVRQLSNKNNKSTSVFVHNEDNQFVNSNVDKCNIVRDYFKQHYTSSVNEPALEPFIGPPQPLTNPITVEEVEMAAKKLKNNKALGPDGIPNEFLKYASPAFYSTFAELINQSFEKHEHVPSFTEGYLTPLQKPGKPRGPPKSLRPLCLLNGTRKILSMIVLRRIQGQIAHYTGPWQNAYKPGHSTANIVWTQRMLLSVVKEKHWSLYKMGIDMTSAFDTIKRSVLLDILREAGCSEDDLKLVRYLLSNTKLKIKIEKTVSGEFIVLIGAFQGDSLSGNLFTVYLAGALYHLRAVTMHIRLNPPISDQLLPLEWEYADDADFVDEEEKNLQALLPICKDVLQEWNLLVNESKTEFTQFYIAGKNERDEKGELLKNREPWRSSISLGSKLCDKEDIQRRCTLGNVAFQDYKKVWEQGQRICLSTRLKIYESLVVSVMLYNCNSWAVPKNYMDKIDICHRKHLRQIVKMTYPTIISNEALYKKCNSRPLSERVAYSRWKMFGHILRSTSNSPAVCSLFFAVNSMRDMKGRVGRHQCNLLKTLKNDLSDRDIKLVNTEDIYNLIFLAQDRLKWRKLF